MSDFDKLYADAKKRHTGLWGVDHAAIRAEFEQRWRQDSDHRDRQLVRASVIVVVLCIATISGMICTISGLIWWGL